jgi:hypothetical protein
VLHKKKLLQSFVVAAVRGFIKARQMAWIMQAATEERMEVPRACQGFQQYAIVMIIIKRHPAFFSHSQSTFPIYQISTAPSLGIVATLSNIPLGETTLL